MATQLTAAGLYTVGPADLNRDRDIILQLWCENLPAHTPEEHRLRFDWHYGSAGMGDARCFLLRHEASGRIVGTSGIGLRRLEVGGRSLRAGIAIDFAVKREHRIVMPALMLIRHDAALLGNEFEVIYGLPNRHAAGVFRRVGFQHVGSFRRFVGIVDPCQYLARKGIPGVTFEPASKLARLALWARDRIRDSRKGKARLEEISWTDPRIFEICRMQADQFRLVGERTPEYIDWRFRRCPLHRHQILGLTTKDGRTLIGYAIVYVREHQAKVADFLMQPGTDVGDLLFALKDWSRRHGLWSLAIEVMNPKPELGQRLKSCGYFDRGITDNLIAKTRNPGLDLSNWHFLRADEFYNTM